MAVLIIGCGDEGTLVDMTLPSPDESEKSASAGFQPADADFSANVPAAPLWQPDAITMDELIYPYAARQCVGIHNIIGEEFRLASCEVLYRSRRVRRSERNNRWVRLGTGYTPAHATRWTHNRVPQFLYIFLNFQNEADYQRFQVGTHENVAFTVRDAFSIGENTWELTLLYQSATGGSRTPVGDTSVEDTPTDPIANREALSVEQLASLAFEEREALYGTQTILTTTLSIVEKGTSGGRYYIRVLPTGHADLRIFIASAEDTFDPNTEYYYVRVSVERFFLTGTGFYELWLAHVPD